MRSECIREREERIMGCFNTITIVCPRCGDVTEFQSKAGTCELATYSLEDAPLPELAELEVYAKNKAIVCGGCLGPLQIKVWKIASISMLKENTDE